MGKLESKLIAILQAHGELAGREVAKIFKHETGRSISYGTLYVTFRRLADQNRVKVRESEDNYGKIRFFSLPD